MRMIKNKFLLVLLLTLVFSVFAPQSVSAGCNQVAGSSSCPSGDIYWTCPDADGIKIHYCCEDGGGGANVCCDESFPPAGNYHIFYDSTNTIGETSVNCTFTNTLSSFTCPTGQTCIDNPLGTQSFSDLIDSIIDFIFNIAVALAPVMIVIAGFYFVTAAGDPAKITTAKQIIFWTFIGLSIALLATGLIDMIKQVLQ